MRDKVTKSITVRKWSLKKLESFIESKETSIEELEISIERRINELNWHELAVKTTEAKEEKARGIENKKINSARERLKQAKRERGFIPFLASAQSSKKVTACEANLQNLLSEDDTLGYIDSDEVRKHKHFIYGKCKMVNGNAATGAEYYNHLKYRIAIDKAELLAAKKLIPSIRKDQKIKQLKSRVAAKESEVRGMAGSIKRTIKSSQMKLLDKCPYCDCRIIDKNNTHADHIYPVSKGGLSTEENMVYVCAKCNLSKKDKTLNTFIRDGLLDREVIESNLALLGKDF